VKKCEGRRLFEQMHPDFFSLSGIASLGKGAVYEEMTLLLEEFSVDALKIPVPQGIRFGFFEGDFEALHRNIDRVSKNWAQYFNKPEEIFCAYDGNMVVSFCLLDDMGEHELEGRKVRVAGPGCVGTIPEYRKQGIGLRMVQLGTQILKERGYEISYIHYTAVGPWYAKLGYETLLKWDRDGIVEE